MPKAGTARLVCINLFIEPPIDLFILLFMKLMKTNRQNCIRVGRNDQAASPEVGVMNMPRPRRTPWLVR